MTTNGNIMHPPYSACQVADFILREGLRQGAVDLTNIKLNRLVYIAHGWSLGFLHEPLVADDAEVWKYGPTFSRLFYWIDSRLEYPGDVISEPDFFTEKIGADCIAEQDEQTCRLLRHVCGIYMEKTVAELILLTYSDGSPWWQSRWQEQLIIPDKAIQNYYEKRIRASK